MPEAPAEGMARTEVMPPIRMPGGGIFGRGARSDVRNPILSLPEAQEIIEFLRDKPELRRKFGAMLRALAKRSRTEGQQDWGKAKYWMGLYGVICCVYINHIARAIDRRSRRPVKELGRNG